MANHNFQTSKYKFLCDRIFCGYLQSLSRLGFNFSVLFCVGGNFNNCLQLCTWRFSSLHFLYWWMSKFSYFRLCIRGATSVIVMVLNFNLDARIKSGLHSIIVESNYSVVTCISTFRFPYDWILFFGRPLFQPEDTTSGLSTRQV